MPYIKQVDKGKFSQTLSVLPGIEDAGELNYLLTKIALRYLRQHGLRYKFLNDILGAFTGAKDEFYRRIVTPYEMWKAHDNGEVYPIVVKLPDGQIILEDRS